MDTNKMRDAFEVALAKQAAEDGFAKPSLRRNTNNGDYVDPFEQAAWWGWQASRSDVMVELPEGMTLNELRYGSKPKPEHARLILRRVAVAAIEAQGLKVAP